METATTIKPATQRDNGYHDCGANYGWCGEHRAFKATYECPECNHRFTIEQCAAWPITQQDCPTCFADVQCELDSKRAKCVLR